MTPPPGDQRSSAQIRADRQKALYRQEMAAERIRREQEPLPDNVVSIDHARRRRSAA